MFLFALYTSFRAAILCVIQYFHLFTSQRVVIGRISLSQFTLYDVKYAGTLYGEKYHPEFSVCSTHFQFHLPTPSLPRWLTMVSEGIVYTSETGDVSVDRSSVTLWLFPVLFKQTAGPWVNVNMEGVKIRIPNGKSTPHFVKQLRKNLVGTLVCGEIYRVDDFGTKIIFAGLTDKDAGAGNDNQHDGNKRHQETSSDIHTSSRSQTKDELRISSFLRGLHLHNTEGRIYTFGEVDAQLRRNWIENRGSFVMVAKESRWLRVHWPYQRLKTIPTWVQFLSAIIQFPLDLLHALRHPMSTINLYITQVDVTFDEFKIRDAELIMQMIGIIAEKRHLHNIQWQDVFADALAQCLQGLVS